MSKAPLEKLPQSEGADYFIVLDPKEGIVHHAYTADLGRSFGHEHIKDAQLDGVASAVRWVVRPLFTAEPDLLKDRDEAEEFADKILDLVLGTDRNEWTSHYGREDALAEVEDKMATPAAAPPDALRAIATEELAQLGYTFDGDRLIPPDFVGELMHVVQTAPPVHPHHCTARSADGACEECEAHAQAMREWKAEQEGGAPGTFPAMTEELASILGLMCFQCISFAQALRAGGYSIKKRAEDEQAAVLHWMLGHYFHSGADGWRAAARADMERMREASTKEGGAA